jgi:hypothetical protein
MSSKVNEPNVAADIDGHIMHQNAKRNQATFLPFVNKNKVTATTLLLFPHLCSALSLSGQAQSPFRL